MRWLQAISVELVSKRLFEFKPHLKNVGTSCPRPEKENTYYGWFHDHPHILTEKVLVLLSFRKSF